MPRHLPFSPKLSVQVAEPLMPILCSMFPQYTSLGSPREPSELTQILGTMNRLKPLVPGMAPSMRASTRCIIFSVRSCSPHVMKRLVPSILKIRGSTASGSGMALVLSHPTSDPASGSVRHMVPPHTPVYIFSTNSALSSSVPKFSIKCPFPTASPG